MPPIISTARGVGGGKGTGGQGGNARFEGDSRVSCCVRLLAYLTLEVFFHAPHRPAAVHPRPPAQNKATQTKS
jgi:hypothetical protein